MKTSTLYIILVLAIMVVVSGFMVFSDRADNGKDDVVACATDAKICPDGTAVSRIAPDCEFAPCPGEDGVIGGQRDENGCLGPAGYAFVENIGACARDWEIDTQDKRQAARTSVEYVGFEKGLTVISVEVIKCPGCFVVNLANGDKLTSVSLVDWEVFSVDEVEIQRPSDKGDDNSVSDPVSIESDFGTKIVYGTSQSVDISPLMKDCESRGGVFNTCGNPCEPDAEMCIDVCAFTCESIFK